MQKIKAKYFSRNDIPCKVSWMNDRRINESMFFTLPATIKATISWFDNNIDNKNRVDFTFFVENEIIAMAGISNIDFLARHGEFYIMVSPEQHGKGFGRKVSLWLFNYAFIELKLNKLYLYTNNDNIAAYKIYENAGFRLEGILRQHRYKKGKLLDRRFYGLLMDEWKMKEWKVETIEYDF